MSSPAGRPTLLLSVTVGFGVLYLAAVIARGGPMNVELGAGLVAVSLLALGIVVARLRPA